MQLQWFDQQLPNIVSFVARGSITISVRNMSTDSEIDILKNNYNVIKDYKKLEKFTDFPLSRRTLCGLTDLNYIYLTEIQRECIGLALLGRDIVGSAITGSGKTLSFLIPVLERLYINKWSNIDGVGAIIISPTRELAYQIFEILKGVGKYHDLSAGLIIGGKNLKFEKKRMDKCNILVCTPGRLLQHMDENPLFNSSNLKVLVLDEADRCLDMGFEKTMNAILENFQSDKQTMIFSATQTQSIKELARLNLNNAKYVSPKSNDNTVPVLLQQSYVVVSLEDKLTVLWSFIKSHLKQKCIIFLASCKQVKYVYEIFSKLRAGTSLLALYGTLHQDRRISIYNEFVKKSNVVLFATDIASRGLDFPLVDWVIQLDCPENVSQYIHRAGRSARNKERGESLLIIMPSEIPMIDELKKNRINIKHIQIDSRKLFLPRTKIEAILAKHPELKGTAKRAFLAYIKAVYNMKNKTIFNVHGLNLDKFANSLGLAITPRIRFIDENRKHMADIKKGHTNNKIYCNEFRKIQSSSESDSEELFTVKIADDFASDLATETRLVNSKRDKFVSRTSQAKKLLKKQILPNTKRKFNEDGDEIINPPLCSKLSERFVIKANIAKKIISEDKFDTTKFKRIVKSKHKSKKNKDFKSYWNSSSYDFLKDVTKSLTTSAVNISQRQQYNSEKLGSHGNITPRKDNNCEILSIRGKCSPKFTVQDTEAIAKEILCSISHNNLSSLNKN